MSIYGYRKQQLDDAVFYNESLRDDKSLQDYYDKAYSNGMTFDDLYEYHVTNAPTMR